MNRHLNLTMWDFNSYTRPVDLLLCIILECMEILLWATGTGLRYNLKLLVNFRMVNKPKIILGQSMEGTTTEYPANEIHDIHPIVFLLCVWPCKNVYSWEFILKHTSMT